MGRPGVSGAGDALHRLVYHRRAFALSDCGCVVLAVVVDDDCVDLGVRGGTQMDCGGLDGVQRRREVGLFVEGGDDDGELQGRASVF